MASARLLVIDDEIELNLALCESLTDAGYSVVGKPNGSEGLTALREDDFDVMLCDLMMPQMDGIQVLRAALENDPNVVGIIMTGQGTIATAVEAMRLGAFDYLLKPFSLQSIMPILKRALEVRQLRTENRRLRQIVRRITFESPRYELIGQSFAMRRVIEMMAKVAATDSTVLITGESGTGKELVARALHGNSQRRDQALVTINCAALQENLLESELFGHEKGAFTGAQQAKPGLFEVAEAGTLFIDEVGELAPALQAKLLRVLEDGHYRRVGGTRECRANVRLIAATNRSLEEEHKSGRFREDLFYRLNVFTIELPPLRQRRDDIPSLIEHFLTTRQLGKTRSRVEPDAMRLLLNYRWPGNIRELANVLERAQILAEDNLITVDDLPESLQVVPVASVDDNPLNLVEQERKSLQIALQKTKGNKVQAAKLLGISRRSLYRLVEKYGLEKPGDSATEGNSEPCADTGEINVQ